MPSTTLEELLNIQAASLKKRLERVPPRVATEPTKTAQALCIPDCQICNGQGWLRREAKPGESAFGLLEPCPNKFKAITAAGDDRFGLDATEMQGLGWDSIRLELSAEFLFSLYHANVPRIQVLDADCSLSCWSGSLRTIRSL